MVLQEYLIITPTDMIEGGGYNGFVNGNENAVFFLWALLHKNFKKKNVGEASEIW